MSGLLWVCGIRCWAKHIMNHYINHYKMKSFVLSEITDRTGSNLDNKIITTLKSTK